MDPINHSHRWIHVEMEKSVHPHWWKELKASGRVSMCSHIVRKDLGNSEALQWAYWQVAAFRLPLAQHKALRWWDGPPGLADSATEISCSILMSLAKGISRL